MTPLIAFKPIPTREPPEQLPNPRLERRPSAARRTPLPAGFCAGNATALVDSAAPQLPECCSLSASHGYFITFADSILGFFLFLFSFVGFLFFATVGSFLFFVLHTGVNCFVIAFPVPSNFNGKKLYPGGWKGNRTDYFPGHSDFCKPKGNLLTKLN